jgi:hypothetical protein
MERPERTATSRPIGVIYVAIRPRFVSEAALSAQSVRRFLPDVPIVLFTDQALEAHDAFDEIIRLSPRIRIRTFGGRLYRPHMRT